jgi:hypothetical protein
MINACVNKQSQLLANGGQNNSDLRVLEMAFVAGKCHLWAELKYRTTATVVFLDHTPVVEGATLLQTVGNHTPNSPASPVTRLKSST